ncbi:MAG: hypothetical protein J6A95_06120, partial [Clostridia bacterium]|nr:hypothetical protein [Clostridia bacterium]
YERLNCNKMRYSKSDVFETITETKKYGARVFEGKIKAEFIGKLTTDDVAQICDEYCQNFGNTTYVKDDGTFYCEIWID